MDPNLPTPPAGPEQVAPILPPSAAEPPRGSWLGVFSTVSIFLAAPIIAIVLTAFVFQSYQVDGPSMESTLHNNDRLIVLKVPRTVARITGHPFIPNRGDIIIFVKHNLVEYGQAGDKQLIKRVIGLPGDRVVVSDGKVTIYNKDHPNGFEPDISLPYRGSIPYTPGEIDTIIPPGQVFVCGDNRSNSLDSRSFGPVSANDIVGKLIVRLYPLGSTKKF